MIRNIIKIIDGILDAIDFLHRRNTIHKDIKPGNIMIKKNGQPVLIDFGTAKQTQNVQTIQDDSTAFFTPDWTCHHQMEGHATSQCDIYALGRTMFYMSTRQNPSKHTSGISSGWVTRLLSGKLVMILRVFLKIMRPGPWRSIRESRISFL